MGMYSQTLRIHSARPLPTPTAQRKNATLLRMVANFALQSVGGHAKAQSFDVLQNAQPAARAAQRFDATELAEDDDASIRLTNVGDIRFTGMATPAETGAAIVAAQQEDSEMAIRTMLQSSHMRGTFAVTTFSTGEKVGVGQWQFTAVRGTPTEYGQFSIGNTDEEGATSLALAINRHPGCSTYFQAMANVTDVYVWRISVPPNGGSRLVAESGKHTVTQITAGARVVVRTAQRTTFGNFISISVVGAVTRGGDTLVGGAGDQGAADDLYQQTGNP